MCIRDSIWYDLLTWPTTGTDVLPSLKETQPVYNTSASKCADKRANRHTELKTYLRWPQLPRYYTQELRQLAESSAAAYCLNIRNSVMGDNGDAITARNDCSQLDRSSAVSALRWNPRVGVLSVKTKPNSVTPGGTPSRTVYPLSLDPMNISPSAKASFKQS